MTRGQRNAHARAAVAIATLNLLDLTGLWDQPMPVPAMLFALNTVLLIRLIGDHNARRQGRG